MSPACVSANVDKVAPLAGMPMAEDVKQLRSILGGLSYYRMYFPNVAKRIQPIT